MFHQKHSRTLAHKNTWFKNHSHWMFISMKEKHIEFHQGNCTSEDSVVHLMCNIPQYTVVIRQTTYNSLLISHTNMYTSANESRIFVLLFWVSVCRMVNMHNVLPSVSHTVFGNGFYRFRGLGLRHKDHPKVVSSNPIMRTKIWPGAASVTIVQSDVQDAEDLAFF